MAWYLERCDGNGSLCRDYHPQKTGLGPQRAQSNIASAHNAVVRITIRNYELKIRRIRVSEQDGVYGRSIAGPEDVADIARQLIGDAAEERFCVFLLDVKNRVLGFSETARGGVDSCVIDPRTVFRAAVAVGAVAIAISHNHPSGDPKPSREDLNLTERLKSVGGLLGIESLDHVIVTDTRTSSLLEQGLL